MVYKPVALSVNARVDERGIATVIMILEVACIKHLQIEVLFLFLSHSLTHSQIWLKTLTRNLMPSLISVSDNVAMFPHNGVAASWKGWSARAQALCTSGIVSVPWQNASN